jgi:hypothetical protein
MERICTPCPFGRSGTKFLTPADTAMQGRCAGGVAAAGAQAQPVPAGRQMLSIAGTSTPRSPRRW